MGRDNKDRRAHPDREDPALQGLVDQLDRLTRLRDAGELNEDEFAAAKHKAIVASAADADGSQQGAPRPKSDWFPRLLRTTHGRATIAAVAVGIAIIAGIATSDPSFAEHQRAVAEETCEFYDMPGSEPACVNSVRNLLRTAHETTSTERCLLSKFLNMTTYEDFDIRRACGPDDEPGDYGDWFEEQYFEPS